MAKDKDSKFHSCSACAVLQTCKATPKPSTSTLLGGVRSMVEESQRRSVNNGKTKACPIKIMILEIGVVRSTLNSMTITTTNRRGGVRSLDLLVKFVSNVFKKVSKRARPSGRFCPFLYPLNW
ncbi:hypothetical protein Peur_036305 [Populus x canadensis]